MKGKSLSLPCKLSTVNIIIYGHYLSTNIQKAVVTDVQLTLIFSPFLIFLYI